MPHALARHRAVVALTLGLAVRAPAVAGQGAGPAPEGRGPAAAFAGASLGTARLPLASAMRGSAGRLGIWGVSTHGVATVNYRSDPGPRGGRDLFLTNMLMASGRRPLGAGWLELRGMVSGEPVLGPTGYSLLLQTGETADGINPLVDRQHPHDLLMELSASYRVEVDAGAWAFLYVAPVGDPALGPVSFMHRPSARGNPIAPLTHHVLDATHVANGVVTAGLFVDQRFQIELSYFNAREPDQNRWSPEAPAPNSFGGRITVTPGPSWAVQASFANLVEPEQLHPAIDVYRITLSVAHHRELANGVLSSTLAFGRNTYQRTTMTLGEARRRLSQPLLEHYVDLASLPADADESLTLLFPRRRQSALLVESSLVRTSTTVFGRYEWVEKDELFPPSDTRHSQFFDVSKASLGVVRGVATVGRARLGIGGTASVHFVPDELASVYGGALVSYMIFARVGV